MLLAAAGGLELQMAPHGERAEVIMASKRARLMCCGAWWELTMYVKKQIWRFEKK
jgi:hypothetical protein